MAVGSPRAASAANDGPEITAMRGVNFGEKTCAITSLIRRCVPGSRPLLALTKLASVATKGSAEAYTTRACAEGMAPRMTWAPESAASNSV